MGCGWTDSQIFQKYKGFGNQIWFGANHITKLAKEWTPGQTQDIDGTTVTPTDAATWGLYRYTPHFPGKHVVSG